METLTVRRKDDPANRISQLRDCSKAEIVSVRKHEDMQAVSVVLFDRRSCFSEALSRTLEQITHERVLAVHSIAELQSCSTRLNSGNPTILYCAVAGAQARSRKELDLIRDCMPDARTCVLADRLDGESLQLFDEFQLQGIIPSEYDTRQLAACLKTIASGVRFLPAHMRETGVAESATTLHPPTTKFNARLSRLTPRQQQVLAYIEVGRSNKFIAAELKLCESTVKVHVSELMKRLGASSRTHAVHLATGIAMEQAKA